MIRGVGRVFMGRWVVVELVTDEGLGIGIIFVIEGFVRICKIFSRFNGVVEERVWIYFNLRGLGFIGFILRIESR